MREVNPSEVRNGWTLSCLGKNSNMYGVALRKPEGKRPLVRPRRKWEDISMDVEEVWFDWIYLSIWASGRLFCTR